MRSFVMSILLLAAPTTIAAQTAPTAGTVAAKPVPPAEKMRCRTSVETGSLARRTKVCRTVGEWRKLETREQEDANNLMDRSRSVPCGECLGPPAIGTGP